MLDEVHDILAAGGRHTAVTNFSDRQAGAAHTPLMRFGMAIGKGETACTVMITSRQISPYARVDRQAEPMILQNEASLMLSPCSSRWIISSEGTGFWISACLL